jgi:pimeloyl-ACP methyl ester carboxylesterase
MLRRMNGSPSPREVHLQLPRLQVRTIDEGKGPAVLLLHGHPDNADEYEGLVRLLRDDFRCIAPDLPGYGRTGATSPLGDFDYSRRSQVQFVNDVLDALHVDGPVTLVVHDVGGIMGVPWAAENTARLRGVVYTNTVAFPKFPWFGLANQFGARSWSGRRWAELNMTFIGSFDGWIFRRLFSKQNPQLDAAQIDRFVKDFALNPIALGTTLRHFRQVTRLDFFDGCDDMLKAISKAVPTVALWGAGDPYLADTTLVEQMFARRTTVLPPDIGHWVPITATAQVAEAVRSFSAAA